MALIKCPECGKEISDKANACIHCGFPLNKKRNIYTNPSNVIKEINEYYENIKKIEKPAMKWENIRLPCDNRLF